VRLDDDDRSNVEDRRGLSSLGGSGMKLGLGGTLVVLVLSVVFRQDLFSVLGGGGAPVAAPASPAQVERRESAEADLERVAVASFNDAQKTWAAELERRSASYPPARLVLFWDETRSGCGDAPAAMGPFYCPLDAKVYIDLGFYRELAARFHAAGTFAQAYVIAHEVGHHVQSVIGVEKKVSGAQRRDPAARNDLSVRMELQADCLAGAWARSAEERRLLDPGDFEAALNAAAAVGDDRVQKATGGSVHPESFTHGTAAQRSHWFRQGFDAGRLEACDTFAAERP
jgi:predicted metalloprotease